MKLLTFQKLGVSRDTPRLWIESRRLTALGFNPGSALTVRSRHNGVTISPAILGNNHVASKTEGGLQRPIIDIANRETLAALVGFSEIKVTGSFNQLDVTPSARAFYISKRLAHRGKLKTLEVFSGGGTLSQAITSSPDFELVAGVELEPKFADVWQEAHPDATLIQADFRMVHPSEFPPFDVAVFALPCTSHSGPGRAKKGLKGIPELGDTGDLFISVCSLIAARMPLACVFENVPQFATSLAGQTLTSHLRKLGYHITETIVNPLEEWNEPQDRRRWIAVATLQPGFEIKSPGTPFAGTLADFLDQPHPQDAADVARISKTIDCLRVHNARHAAKGNGFAFTTINGESQKCPTLVRSYHKINVGPFVETSAGLRMLRKGEAERLMGTEAITTPSYSTAIEILGQGVQPRIFKTILNQLATFIRQ